MFNNIICNFISFEYTISSEVSENPEMIIQPSIYFGKRQLNVLGTDKERVEMRERCLYNNGYRNLILSFEVDLKSSVDKFNTESIVIKARKYKEKTATELSKNNNPVDIKLLSEYESSPGFKVEQFYIENPTESGQPNKKIGMKLSLFGLEPYAINDFKKLFGIPLYEKPEQNGYRIIFQINRVSPRSSLLEIISDMFIIIFNYDNIQLKYVDSIDYQNGD